jgi:hypothetical protein
VKSYAALFGKHVFYFGSEEEFESDNEETPPEDEIVKSIEREASTDQGDTLTHRFFDPKNPLDPNRITETTPNSQTALESQLSNDSVESDDEDPEEETDEEQWYYH